MKIVPYNLLILIKKIVSHYFSYCYAYIARPLRNLCTYKFQACLVGHLWLISFAKKLIIIKMISKKTQAMHVKKGDDKIVITQATRVPLWAP